VSREFQGEEGPPSIAPKADAPGCGGRGADEARHSPGACPGPATRRARGMAAILIVIALVAPPRGEAHADPGALSVADKKIAADLKQQGDDAMVSLRYGEALDAYTKAYKLTEDPALLYNRGRALQALGKFPEALEQIVAFEAQAPAQLKARVPALDALVAELRAKVSAIALASNVKGARILIDKKVVGVTPLAGALKLNAGSVLIEVEAEDYATFSKRIDLRGGQTASIFAKLSPKSRMGVLSVVSSTTGARVIVDGKPAGSVPVELSLNAGLHALQIERAGYESVSTSAMIVAGARKQMTIPLAPVPVVQRGWFWASVGAGAATVAAVVVLTQVIVTPLAPGSLPPGTISWPPPSSGGAGKP
jgi:PEGA domain